MDGPYRSIWKAMDASPQVATNIRREIAERSAELVGGEN